METKWNAQAEMLINRVRKKERKLRAWLKSNRISCYRLYDRDIPEIPICVDWYEGRLHVSLYENRARVDNEDAWVAFMANALRRGMGLDGDALFIKRRRRAEGGTQYSLLGEGGALIKVQEMGLAFWVNLEDYLDTGLFLDHRLTRQMVREMSDGKRVLNLFAYTGAFSVYAAVGGAESVTTVDLSGTYLDWARRNMVANGFDGAPYTYVRDDVLGAITDGRIESTYDLIVLDPPTISKSKRMPKSLDVQRDHPAMIAGLLKRLSTGGRIVFSNNYRRFKLDDALNKAAAIKEITAETTSKDFADRPNHRCWIIEAR